MEKLGQSVVYVELFAMICSFIAYYLHPGKTKLAISIILFVIVFTDWMSFLNLTRSLGINKVHWFNLLVPIHLCLWGNLIIANLVNARWVRLFKILLLIYLTFSVCVFLYLFSGNKFMGFGKFFTPGYTSGVIILSIICFRYLYEHVNSNRIIQKWYESILLIVFGLLIFYLGTLPFHAMRSYLYYNFPNIFTVYFYLFIILNYCLYLIISSIVLCLKER